MAKPPSRYEAIIEKIFFAHYKKDLKGFEFAREEIRTMADALGIRIPDNVGDLIYSFRFRTKLPMKIIRTQPPGKEWVISLAGRARYKFELVSEGRIIPREDLIEIAIPDATPEVIETYRLDDEQSLLAVIRYNRLIDIFLGLTAYSLQNHLRTTVSGVGQIEIDEIYVGLDKYGCHYMIPVQAKSGKDKIGIVQIAQDIHFAKERFPGLRCRPVAAQFMAGDVVALFELALVKNKVKVVDEKHYCLVQAGELNDHDLRDYRD